MITTGITAAITWILAQLGIQPRPSMVAGIWVAVKICIVGVMAVVGLRVAKKVNSSSEGSIPKSTTSETPPNEEG